MTPNDEKTLALQRQVTEFLMTKGIFDAIVFCINPINNNNFAVMQIGKHPVIEMIASATLDSIHETVIGKLIFEKEERAIKPTS